jgi:hypothetical protein
MNTAIIVEPRQIDRVVKVIQNFQSVLPQSEWSIVFYCGKGLSAYWSEKLFGVEIRELEVNNLEPYQYNDMFKSRQLWDSLYGEYVLVFQLDTWLHPESNYTIRDFTSKEYSYIGGNLDWIWDEFVVLDKLQIPYGKHKYGSFNGGLSLRKRADMIRIIEEIPPMPTPHWSVIRREFESPTPTLDTIKIMAEDTYFTLGSYVLGLKVGDDAFCEKFACHQFFVEKPFGYHLSIPYPVTDVKQIGLTQAIRHDCPNIACWPYCDES